MSEEKQMPDGVDTIDDLVKYSLAQDYNKANEVFGNVITTKLADVLDQAKVKLAGQIFNGDPEDLEDPLEDEDFEETDETEETEEEGDGEEVEDEADEEEVEDDEEEEVEGNPV